MINNMNDSSFVFIILGAMLATYLPRMLPLVVLSKVALPKKVLKFLDYVPIAILGAILIPSLVMKDQQLDLSFGNEFLIAGVLTIILAKFVKRVDVIVLFGILVTILLRLIT